MQDIQTMVVGGGPKPTQKGGTYYEVYLSINGQNTKTTTFDAGLFQRASALYEVPNAKARLEQNGSYLNLKEIVGPDEQLSPIMVPGGGIVGGGMGGGGMGMDAMGTNGTSFGNTSDGRREEVNTRIAKQEATRSAAIIAAALFQGAGPEAAQEAADVTLALGKQFFEKAKGSPQAVNTPQTAVEVAQQVQGVQVGTEGVETPAEAPETAPASVPDEW